jgi:hypothetical protein
LNKKECIEEELIITSHRFEFFFNSLKKIALTGPFYVEKFFKTEKDSEGKNNLDKLLLII